MEIFPVVPPAPNATPDAMVDLALAHLEMIDLIAYALDGFSVAAEGIGGMMWVGMAPGLSNVSDITEDIMVWRVRLTTDVAKRILINAAPVDPVVTPVVIHP